MFHSLYSFVALWLVSHPVVFFLIELNRLIEVLIKMRGQETKLKDKGENEAHLIQSSEHRNLCLMQLLEERKGSWGSSRRNLGWGSKVEAASCQKKKSWGRWAKRFIWSMDFPWVLMKQKSPKFPIRGWSQDWGESHLWCWVYNYIDVVCSNSGSWVWKGLFFCLYWIW